MCPATSRQILVMHTSVASTMEALKVDIRHQRRSYNMSRIHSKNTRPELKVRSILHSYGLRYRLHNKHLPGKPDISIKKFKVAIEVMGCFWHQHKNCRYASIPKTNTEYWIPKLESNQQRDIQNRIRLKHLGYTLFSIWECETKTEQILHSKAIQIMKFIETSRRQTVHTLDT